MSKLCEKCTTNRSFCDRCRDNPKYDNIPTDSFFSNYKPVCPFGYCDCICDPAYIKFHYPDWYEDLYGTLSPEDAVQSDNCMEVFKMGAESCPYYDDEDK